MTPLSKQIIERFGYDEPILTEDILDMYPSLSRTAIYKKIDAAITEESLERYARGIYYVPRTTPFGKSEPLASQVVRRRWISDGENVFGYYSGQTLENKVGLSSQVPAVLEVTTNKASMRVREVEPFGGWRKVLVRKPRTTVTEENVDALMLLDLLTSVSPADLGSTELANLKKLASKAGRKKTLSLAELYPAKTSKRLIESEAYNVFT
ncbi:hypothetical protein [Raoultibacter massiliensis]|uniref:hypothetical protein n=1 Tax=Raoultibacter massiliensis TaxID=1852371 RepID=UPI000C83F2E3|nr:hypothetical protein [Raoultibacter massiliensis]